jgi:hypothetical protein
MGAAGEDGAGGIRELEGAEAAFKQAAASGAFAGGTPEVVEASGEEDEGEADAGVDEEQFVELEAEHYLSSTASSPQ